MSKKSNILILFLLLLFATANAQQDAHYSQYMFNGLAINPAYAGSRNTIASTLFFRKQWVGFVGSPTSESFSFHMPLKNKRNGVGFNFSNDKAGYVNQQWVYASYAYRIPWGNGALALGLQGGFLNHRINWEEAIVNDPDANIPGVSENRILPNFGTGVYYRTDKYFLGISVPHLLNSKLQNSNTNADEFAKVYRHYFFTGGVIFGSGSVKIKPTFLLKYIDGIPLQAELNMSVIMNEKFWAGVGYRTFDALSLMMQYNITPGLRLGYAFDFTISELSSYNSGSHELMLGYEFHRKSGKLKSPRYF